MSDFLNIKADVVTNESLKDVLQRYATKIRMFDGSHFMFLPCWFEAEKSGVEGEIKLLYAPQLSKLPAATRRYMIEETEEFLTKLKDEDNYYKNH